MAAWETPPARIADALRLLRRVEGSVRALADQARECADVETGAAYWAGQMQEAGIGLAKDHGSLTHMDRNSR